eukprot:6582665-Lingulodinium_polyedra.AAC.1
MLYVATRKLRYPAAPCGAAGVFGLAGARTRRQRLRSSWSNAADGWASEVARALEHKAAPK